MEQQVSDSLSNTGSIVQWLGVSASAVLAFMNSNAAALGVIIAIIGLWMNYHYKRKAIEVMTAPKAKRRKGDIPEALEQIVDGQ